MAANNRQGKSSSFLSPFGLFKAKKGKGGYYESYDDLTKRWRPSDEDRGRWGVAEPGIDMKAEVFIAQYKKRIFDSELKLIQLEPATAKIAAAEEE